MIVRHMERRFRLLVVEASHPVDDKAAGCPFQREIFPRGPCIEGVGDGELSVSIEGLLAHNHPKDRCIDAPLFVEIDEKREEFVPVGGILLGIEIVLTIIEIKDWRRLIFSRG